jgi:phosphate transport system substrate-binding protein
VRAVPLAEKDGMPFKEASQQNADNGSYPLWRLLYLYVNKAPNKPLDPIVGEFIKFIYSKEGQQLVVKDGFFPLKAIAIEQELQKLD